MMGEHNHPFDKLMEKITTLAIVLNLATTVTETMGAIFMDKSIKIDKGTIMVTLDDYGYVTYRFDHNEIHMEYTGPVGSFSVLKTYLVIDPARTLP